MESSNERPKIKRYLSELSSLLIQEKEKEVNANNLDIKNSFVEVKLVDISQNIIKKPSTNSRPRARKLRIHDNLVVFDKLPKVDSSVDEIPVNEVNDHEHVGNQSIVSLNDTNNELSNEFFNLQESESHLVNNNESLGIIENIVPSSPTPQEKASTWSTKSLNFPQEKLRKIIKTLLGNGSSRYTLPIQSMDEMNRIFDELIEYLASDLMEMKELNNSIGISKESMLKIFSQLGIIDVNATNHDIFNLCSEYLSLEELNELETALFT